MLSKAAPILAPYVDNGNLICRGRVQAVTSLRSLMQVLDEEGMVYRDVVEAQPVLESIGLVLHGPEREVRNKPPRVWRLYFAASRGGAERASFWNESASPRRSFLSHLYASSSLPCCHVYNVELCEHTRT